MQLAIHYMLDSEQVAREFFTQVYRVLKAGGIFVGSLVSSGELFKRYITKTGMANDLFRIEFDKHSSKNGQ